MEEGEVQASYWKLANHFVGIAKRSPSKRPSSWLNGRSSQRVNCMPGKKKKGVTKEEKSREMPKVEKRKVF